jgi:hypothetical protein
VLETGKNLVGIKDGFVQSKSAQSGCTGLSGGAPDSVRCARLTQANLLLSGNRQRRTSINHRTVRWCTRLSGEPTVSQANGRPRNPRATRGMCQRSEGAPNCSVCTRQCPVRQRLQDCNGRLRQIRKEIRTGLSGGASDCPVRQATEGKNCLPGMLSTAPSCPGAIKGTPRRMEEYTKHSQSIPKHQDLDFAHLILCDSNRALFEL